VVDFNILNTMSPEHLQSPLTVSISVPFKNIDKYLVGNGEGKVLVVFKTMTHGVYEEFESVVSQYPKENDESEMKKLFLKYMLIKWNLNVKLCFDSNGALSDDCLQNVLNVPASIISRILWEYEQTFYINKEGSKKLESDAKKLFAPKSKGVDNPSQYVSLYCTLTAFWDKFGLNYFDLMKLPKTEFMGLKMVLKYENEAREKEYEQMNKKPKTGGSKKPQVQTIFNGSGKPSASKGTVTPLPGSK